MACATSCKTRDHRTYGECLRSKGVSTAAGETTKASGPTKANDALTAKAAPSRREPCPGIHDAGQSLGRTRCKSCGYVWINNRWVAPEDAPEGQR